MISKLLLCYVFYVNYYFCVAEILTTRENNSVICTSSKEDLQNETPVILKPPIYKNKTDSKKYFELKANFYDWKILDSRNLFLGPVLDKRWENFPVEENNVLEFKSIQELTPFSVCINGKIEIRVTYQDGFNNFIKGETIFNNSNNKIENKNCEWVHYSIEMEKQNIILYENYEKIINKTLMIQFAATVTVRVNTSGISFWKRHLYEFQQIRLNESNLIKNYNLGAISRQGNLCISLYVALTRDLSLKIRLKSEKSSDEKIVTFSKRFPKTSWQNVKLNINSNGPANISIEATSKILYYSNPFWLIDLKNVKFCSKKYETQTFFVSWETHEDYTCDAITVHYKKLKEYFEEQLKIENEQNKILLSWNIPDGIFNIVQYVVVYQMIEKLSCKHNNETRRNKLHYVSVNGSETSVQLTNLQYFARYSLNVSVITDKENITISKNATTRISLKIEDITTNLTFTENKFINLLFEDCDHFNGPLNITLSLKCLDKWCLNQTQNDKLNIDFKDFQKNIKLTKIKLQTFTSYQPEIEMSRSNETRNKIFPIIRTNPGDPTPVENLTVEHTSSELFLKWKAPYPPTGIVSYYIIRCEDERSVFTQFNISSESYCSTSQEFLCANITNLMQSTTYFIKIFVKNQNIEKIDSSMNISVISTKPKILNAPSNLALKWNNSTRKFQLSWDYPHILGSSLSEFFIIRIIDEKGNKKESKSLNNTSKLDLEHFVFYNISVKVGDKDFRGESTINVRIFPPFQDLNKDFPIIEKCSNSTSCTLAVYDAQNEKILKKRNKKNSEIDHKLIKCLTSPKKWITLNETTIEKNYYKRINFGGGAGIIFNLNNKTFCSATNILIYSQSGVEIIYIILSFMIIVLLILCIYLIIYTYRNKKLSRITQQNDQVIFNRESEEIEIVQVIRTEQNPETIISEPITIEDLEKYLLQSFTNNTGENIIIKQYMSIPKDFREKSRSESILPQNSKKNRYQNILPYDSSRVILQENGERGDYINANYIDGYNCSKEFIATQAPKFNTTDDFWLMIWQNRASSIIMMTELNERDEIKCQKYWPELLQNIIFGKFKITNRYEEIYPYFIERRLEICVKNEKRSIDHFQFIDWPDHDVPSHPQKLSQFLKKVLKLPQGIKIVHCNAGCGRTGSLILCEIALRMALNEGKVDFPKILNGLRSQRMSQVNSLEQYIFCYLSVLEYLKVQQFSIPLSEDFVINSNLKSTLNNLEKLSELLSPKSERDNRYSLSEDGDWFYERSLASSETSLQTQSIISVDSFRCRNKFFAVAQPSNEDMPEFWKLVKEFKINLIIFLNQADSEFNFKVGNETPVLRNSLLQCSEKYETLDFSKMTLKFDSDLMFIYQVKNWESNLPQHECERNLILVLKELSENFRNCKTLVVSDEIIKTGLFIGLALLLEKMITERVFDAFSTIRMLRQNEAQFLHENEQTNYLYEFATVSVNNI